MTAVEIVLGIVLLAMALFLVVAVLMQSGKDKGLSGTITGSADTFFGNAKANTWDKVLSKLTVAISILFTIVVIVLYAIA